MIKMDVRKDDVFGGGCYRVVSSAEITERGHEDDPCMGISIDDDETSNGLLWSAHEYNAEKPDCYYYGHYFLEDENSAWQDFFERCIELAKYSHKWDMIKGGR